MRTQVTISPGGVFVELKAENALEKKLFESFEKADLGKSELNYYCGSEQDYGYSYTNFDKATLSIQIPPRL